MYSKATKLAILVLVFVLFISMVLPAGSGRGFNNERSLVTFPGSEMYHKSTESSYHPILVIEEPKMYFMIKDEEGNGIIVDMPKDIDKNEIENRIMQKIEEISPQDVTSEKKKNKNINEKEPEETLPDEPKEDEKIIEKDPEEKPPNESKEKLEQVESTKVVFLTYYTSEDYLDGYFFCNENELLHFDASYLFSSYTVLRYEWDLNGDGSYEQVSLSPNLSYKYVTKGLYNLRIKITYSYNYSYYPIYFSDTSYINIEPIQLPKQPILTTLDYVETTNNSSSTPEDGSLKTYDEFDRGYIAPSIVEYQNSKEYEIKVSVGSKEKGYPPILDFTLSCILEDEEPSDEDTEGAIQVNLPIEPIIIQPVLPPIITPIIGNPGTTKEFPSQDSTDINENNTDDSLKKPIIHVKVNNLKNEVISYFENCKVKFDASKTIDPNEGIVYFWHFGDGESSEGIEVTHTYAHRGTYTASLFVKDWDHSISKTFVLLRGNEDPNLVVIKNYYTNASERYLICNPNEPVIFDIFDLVRWTDLSWVEWDFNGDGIYEVNVTSSGITKTFLQPGYFEVSFKYTNSYKGSQYILLNYDSYSGNEDNYEEPVASYRSITCWIKVIVKSEDNAYPLIPDFYTKAPYSYSWWNQEEFLEDYFKVTEQKNITYLKCWNNRLNTWKNPVTLNANSTLLPEGTTFDDFFYFWDFGDGETASGIEVIHEFENVQKDYQVKLTVWNYNYNVSTIKMVAPRPYSPNIYLYRETPGYDTIRIIVDGMVTKAVPWVELGTEIEWKDVFIENGKLYYQGKCYDFLYYEELLNKPKTSKYGWILERDEKGNLFLDEKLLSLKELKDSFRSELAKAGLFENEIEDFIDEWLGEGARLFPGQKAFHYAIMYIPEDVIDEVIQIETEKPYDEIIRVHFLVQPVEGDIRLVPPQYANHKNGANVLHEWGVYFGNSISEKGKYDTQASWFDYFMRGHYDPQMYMTYKDRIGRNITISTP